MEKLIVFTNKRSIKNFMPEDRERNKVEFKEIKELENKGVMALRGNVLISDYNEEDILFLASDVIDQQSFKKFYNNIKEDEDDIYILYHLNDHGNKFDHESILFDIDEKRKKVGQHVGMDRTYDVFAQKISSFLIERGVNGREWKADGLAYTQAQVSDIIETIFNEGETEKIKRAEKELLESIKNKKE